MFCPKCKYTTFDFYKKCPKCNYDWDHIRQDLNIEWMLEPDVIEEDISVMETNNEVLQQEKEHTLHTESDTEIEFEDQVQDLDVEKSDKYKEEKELELDPSLFIEESNNLKPDIENKQDTAVLENITKDEEQVEELLEITEIQEHDKNIKSYHEKDEESLDIEFDDLILEEDNIELQDKQTNQQDNFDLDKEIEILLEEDKENPEKQ